MSDPLHNSDAEKRALQVLRGVSSPPPLDQQTAERVWARMRARQLNSKRGKRVAAFWILGGAVAFASLGGWQWARKGAQPQAPVGVTPRANVSSGSPSPSPVDDSVSAIEEALEPEPSVKAAPAKTSRVPGRARGATVPPANGIGEADTLAAESSLMAEALHELRQNEDPSRALKLLDDYSRQFPRGRLTDEATLLKVEAHLGLGDNQSALRVVERRAPSSGKQNELSVLRGELLLRLGRTEEALQIFEAISSASLTRPLLERMLFGLWTAQRRQGMTSAADSTAREYLRRFPEGRFASALSP
jgi:TolA-binding protein